jgi:hypothetical protein
MSRIELDATPFAGRTSRPATSTISISPTCTRCGSDLGGRGQKTERFLDQRTGVVVTVWRWRCGCGRARTLRKLETLR